MIYYIHSERHYYNTLLEVLYLKYIILLLICVCVRVQTYYSNNSTLHRVGIYVFITPQAAERNIIL